MVRISWSTALLVIASGILLGVVIASVAKSQVLGPVSTASHGDGTPSSCDGKPVEFHFDRAKHVIKKAFALERVLDATPATRSEKEAWREHRRCVLSPPRRSRLANLVDKSKARFAEHFESLITPPGRAWLERVGYCESGADGDYSMQSGAYAGRYAFDANAWAITAKQFKQQTGIDPNPSRLALPREQDIRASILYRMLGPKPWPVCGYR